MAKSNKDNSSVTPGMKPKPPKRVFRLTIHPLFLITGVLLAIFLFSGMLNNAPENTEIPVSEFISNIKDNRYSGIDILDSGEILAQEKYVLVTAFSEDDKLKVPQGTKAVEAGINLKEVELENFVGLLKQPDPIEQLKSIFSTDPSDRIAEVIVGEDFVMATRFDPKSEDLIVEGVGEEEFFTALRDADVDYANLPINITYLRSAKEAVDADSFRDRVENKELALIFYTDGLAYGRLKNSEIETYSIKWDGGIRSFAATLQDEEISLASDDMRIGSIIVDTVPWGDILSLLTLVGLVALGYFLFRALQSSGSGLMRFGQSKARMFWGVKPDITFKDVAGVDEAKNELEEVVMFLKQPKKFQKLGARIPKGVLMVGAPGTGKTLLARAVAGEAGVPFFHTSGSEFEEMLVGAGASRVRDLFEKAKKASPALIFIDEIDAVARKRGTTIQSSTTEQTLNQILVEMDGFEQGTNVIVIAATNRPDVLDPAILRPGRFDRRVVLDLPDIEGRKQILAVHAKGKPLAKEVDLERIAKRTIGFSGAELENTLNEAAIIAAKNDRQEIIFEDVEEAATKVVMGPVRKSKKRTDEEVKLVAVHEAGHAVVSRFVPQADPVHRISILSRGMSGGATHFLPQDDNRMMSKTRLVSRIVVALGGRAAEEIVLKDVSTGASADINNVTTIVRNMVQKYGMSDKLGMIKYGESNDLQYLGYGYGEQRDYSDDTAKMIDEEVRNIVEEAYERAKEIIVANRKKFDKLVNMLLEKEVLDANEFEDIFKGDK